MFCMQCGVCSFSRDTYPCLECAHHLLILLKENGSAILYFILRWLSFTLWLLLAAIIVCHLTAGSKIVDAPEVKI